MRSAIDLDAKTDRELDQWIANHERVARRTGTVQPLYRQLLEERARRTQAKHKLNLERSLESLQSAAVGQVCIRYGDLAAASGIKWTQAHHQMNGPGGHLDRLFDLCHARGLPPLTAICVNQAGIISGELDEGALAGFVAAARRLGFLITDERGFHRQCREECWSWGRQKSGV